MTVRLFHGDCLDVMPTLPAASVDLILCDLPYGTTACAWDAIIPFDRLWAEYRRIAKPNAAIVLTASQPFTSALGASNLPWLKYAWYWRKTRATGHLNAKKMPMKDIEDILVFYGALPTYNPQGLKPLGKLQRNSASHIARGVSTDATSVVTGGITKRDYLQESTGYPRQVLDFASEGSTVHPTQKPVALMEYLIRTYTNPGDTVLDNCMGSGTTGVAARNTGRRFIGIERDPSYFTICQERINGARKVVDLASIREALLAEAEAVRALAELRRA
jgi:site-specific DNA-methyltransferase (adenine-specific)